MIILIYAFAAFALAVLVVGILVFISLAIEVRRDYKVLCTKCAKSGHGLTALKDGTHKCESCGSVFTKTSQ
jgi:hypothetical protein